MNLQENPQEKESEEDAIFDEDEFQVVQNSNSSAMSTTEHESQEFTFEHIQEYLMKNLQENGQVRWPVAPDPDIPPSQIYGSTSQEEKFHPILNYMKTCFQSYEDDAKNLCVQYLKGKKIQDRIKQELIEVYGFQSDRFPFAEVTSVNPYNASSSYPVPQSPSEPSQQSFDQLDPSYQS